MKYKITLADKADKYEQNSIKTIREICMKQVTLITQKNINKMTEDNISYKVRGIIFDIYNKLGPGLYESVYEEILAYELLKANLNFTRQKALPVIWEEIKMDHGFRADIIVENKVIIEIKSVELIANIHYKQLLTYLRLSNLKLGLLINFNAEPVFIKRIVNNL